MVHLLQWHQFIRTDITYMFTRILFLCLLVLSGGASASLLSQQGLPAQYMQTTEDAAIWAQVGNEVVNVGHVRAGQILPLCLPLRIITSFASASGQDLSIKAIWSRCRESSALRTALAILISRSVIKT